MNKLMTSALLGATLALAACGGSDEASESDVGMAAETDTMAADPTLDGSGDLTSPAGAGADTGAMDAATGAGDGAAGAAGAGMDPGGAGDAGATAEEDAASGGQPQ